MKSIFPFERRFISACITFTVTDGFEAFFMLDENNGLAAPELDGRERGHPTVGTTVLDHC